MTSQTLNNFNKARYDEFEFALDQVRIAFDELGKFTKSIDNGKRTSEPFAGWQVPTKDEVRKTVNAASGALDVLRTACTKRKTELISRGWRV